MHTTTTFMTLLAASALALSACGGPDQVATRTVSVGQARYEIVASFPEGVDRGDVDRLLARARLVPIQDRAAPLQMPDAHQAIILDVIPLDGEDEQRYAAMVTAESREETAEEERPQEPKCTHTGLDRPGDIKGATDPDVDPAMPL